MVAIVVQLCSLGNLVKMPMKIIAKENGVVSRKTRKAERKESDRIKRKQYVRMMFVFC